MDDFYNTTNRQILSGNLPNKILFACIDQTLEKFDYESKACSVFKLFHDDPKLFYCMFIIFTKRVEELSKLNSPDAYIDYVNIFINTDYQPSSLAVSDNEFGNILNKAFKLTPVVTHLDKVLWYGAYTFYMLYKGNYKNNNYYNTEEMMFAWISLLRLVQEKEYQYGLTIDFDRIDNEFELFNYVFNQWNEIDETFTKNLTEHEKEKINGLIRTRIEIDSNMESSLKQQRIFARQTDDSWKKFIELINDLSEREQRTIYIINTAESAREKRDAINEYRRNVQNFLNKEYVLDDTEWDMNKMYCDVYERYTKSLQFCTVKTENSLPFIMSIAILDFYMDPRTYNFLFISFHHFRLNPSRETAKKFIELALFALKKNLGVEEKSYISMDEMVEDFVETVDDFVNKYDKYIDKLNFSHINEDSIAIAGIDLHPINLDAYFTDFSEMIDKYEKSINSPEMIDDIIEKSLHIASDEEINLQTKEAELFCDEMDGQAIAKRIIISLNIIYMFCDALRIMITNSHACIKFKDRDHTNSCRYKLQEIDAKLVNKVYGNLADKENGMIRYREEKGINTNTLTEIEENEEKKRNANFSTVLKNNITRLMDNIEKKDIEQIFLIKKEIKQEIAMVPECEEKDQYESFFDVMTEKICNTLVKNCKEEMITFSEMKTQILESLGEKSSKLPVTVIDSLSTAEILFGEYATKDFADKGFDYSCISSLYYQAFEDAYNSLIWTNYAQMLNQLIIDGCKYTSILQSSPSGNINVQNAIGYLYPDRKNRSYYVEKDYVLNTLSVKTQCMYKSFAKIMKDSCTLTDLEKFCDYFSHLSGFDNRYDMLNDTGFMNNYLDFVTKIENSAENRNNASHGGSSIDITQCKEDKKTILYDLNTLRNMQIGLIQQLLSLIQ